MFNKYKKIIIVVVILVLIFVGYTLFLKPEDGSNAFIKSSAPRDQQNSAQALGADINRAIREIDSLTLDKSIFEHQVFQKLVDHSEEIKQQPHQRDNPFKPFESFNLPTRSSEEND